MAIQKSHMPSTETKTTYIAVNDHIRDVPGQIFARAQQPLDLRQMLAGVRGSAFGWRLGVTVRLSVTCVMSWRWAHPKFSTFFAE
jgi:hypothetical protein